MSCGSIHTALIRDILGIAKYLHSKSEKQEHVFSADENFRSIQIEELIRSMCTKGGSFPNMLSWWTKISHLKLYFQMISWKGIEHAEHIFILPNL